MKEQTRATPTPWQLLTEGGTEEDEMIVRTILGAGNRPRNLNEVALITTGSFPDDVEEANAQLIVTAVNSHSELVACLNGMVDNYETPSNGTAANHWFVKAQKLLSSLNH